MMNDIDILQQIHAELKKADRPPFDSVLIDFYGRLIQRVPDDGWEQFFLDKDLPEEEVQALRLLNRYEYVEMDRKHGYDGAVYQINLRGKRFLEIADSQAKPAVGGMQDTGKRETFPTGAVRDTADEKSRPDLISPFATERLAERLRIGTEKYAPRNWERGVPVSRSVAGLCRHLMKFQQGCTDEDHLAAVMCNAMFIAHTQEMCKRGVLPESLLDMPKYEPISGVHRNGDEPFEY